jgi:hypothetical protein
MFASAQKEWCEKKTTLLQEYQRTTKVYSNAVADLAKNIGVVSKLEYERLHQITEEARHESFAARDRLDRHIAEHHC